MVVKLSRLIEKFLRPCFYQTFFNGLRLFVSMFYYINVRISTQLPNLTRKNIHIAIMTIEKAEMFFRIHRK